MTVSRHFPAEGRDRAGGRFRRKEREGSKDRWREKEWLRREGRNPRNVFSPEAPVTKAGEGHNGLCVWCKGTEVGPPNRLQVLEHEDRKLSAENLRIGRTELHL